MPTHEEPIGKDRDDRVPERPDSPEPEDIGIGRAHGRDDTDDEDTGEFDVEDRAHGVSRRPNRLPLREEDEEELAEADLMELLDLEDLERGPGPDA